MHLNFMYKSFSILGLVTVLCSCSNGKQSDYSAYFGGEIINPKGNWVLFYQGEKLLDSLSLDQDNRFFVRFDSLAQGLYRFKHENEYQYVYFDKNDSLMVRTNMNNFDESLVFCGKGDEKNNFLVEMYLKNQKDRSNMASIFDLKKEEFVKKTDSFHQEMLKFYTTKKETIGWSDDFDVIAKASTDYPYYSKKEFYPVAHKKRKTKRLPQLSSEFYNHRKNIDFNNQKLVGFEAYIQYVNAIIDNISNFENNEFLSDADVTFKKLEIIDSLTQNQSLKNQVAYYIAYRYLAENPQHVNDTIFFEKYLQVSNDVEKNGQINKLVQSIRNFIQEEYLPNVTLLDLKGNKIASNKLFHRKTILYFWSQKNDNHFFAVHRKLDKIIEKHPNIDLIAVNIDQNNDDWKNFVEKYQPMLNPKIKYFQALDLEKLKDKWAINRETRASIIDKNARITHQFVNIFDVGFEKQF